MLLSTKELIGYNIKALDDFIGIADDFYFDDLYWTIRYLVVDPGTLKPDRKVLLSPVAIADEDWQTSTLSVRLTTTEVENSPNIDVAKPISRQQEMSLVDYFKWPIYWTVEGIAGHENAGKLLATMTDTQDGPSEDESHDPHLRSMGEVVGYTIEAKDGSIGQVEDFIIDTGTWSINYLVINTGNWLAGRKVLIAPSWASQVSWAASKVFIDLTKKQVENSPEYDPAMAVNSTYEKQLYDYYGRPHNIK